MKITSESFEDGESIPVRHTCDGEEVSPPLAWSHVPEGTRSFALIVEDPDAPAGTWIHWVVFNLPATTTGLREGVSTGGPLAGALEGVNGWGRSGYGGPCPPSGTHRYSFRLYALDSTLPLKAGATAQDVVEAARGRILAEAELVGRYTRA